MIVTIYGEIGLDAWPQIDGVLDDLIGCQGNLDVVLDLCEVPYLQRAAVPLIVHAARQAHRHGGHLRLADRACRDHWRASVETGRMAALPEATPSAQGTIGRVGIDVDDLDLRVTQEPVDHVGLRWT